MPRTARFGKPKDVDARRCPFCLPGVPCQFAAAGIQLQSGHSPLYRGGSAIVSRRPLTPLSKLHRLSSEDSRQSRGPKPYAMKCIFWLSICVTAWGQEAQPQPAKSEPPQEQKPVGVAADST